MKVFQDNQIYVFQRYGGVSRYFVELNEALINLATADKFGINAPLHFNAHLSEKRGKKGYIPFTTDFMNFNHKVRQYSDLFSNKRFQIEKPDLIHETYYKKNDTWPIEIPRIATIHDLIREKISFSASKVEKKVSSIKRSRFIICVSENTKNDLLEYYPFINESSVAVVYVGVNRNIFNEKNSNARKNQIVYVGHRDGYKNFQILLKAFSVSKLLREEMKLIAFGGGSFSKNEKESIEKMGLKKVIKKVEGSDLKLASVYRESLAMVYTSIYEGFGSPVLESMSSGCVVLANKTPALMEAGGTSAIYFDTHDVESLVSELEALLVSNGKLNEFRSKGIERAKNFSWELTAKKTREIYREAIN
jgi:glycosyltransferase involved in cell wall biosynthesis